ncbi:peroxiredoxin [Haloarculaceae archaeon H-GB11]|nr:peroxiredoxin [Haloarculaceae archaeon H-GB11]
MVTVGDTAPAFTAPMATGDSATAVEQFSLSEALDDGPVVLAFYPAAFTGGCTDEMCAFRDSMAAFEELDARVFGVSVDLPFAQNVFMEHNGLTFPMLSDADHDVIEAYGVVKGPLQGIQRLARRSVFVVDTDGTVAYRWLREEGETTDYAELVETVREEVAALA